MSVMTRFIASGRYELMRTQWFKAETQRIETETYARFSEELAECGVLRRLFLRVKMRREIQRQLQEIAPANGNY